MARRSRSYQRRQERRATIGRKEAGLSAREALEAADALDLPDGATFALAAEMAGLDQDEFFDQLAASR
ncbi:hypothetical protein SAMN02982917_2316 [Azospirillum oryzae]|uniref:Uncharacterized protein n=1 Tax=Azospirillum oryzae TaxID=286727 RepID=A0A1X7F7N3_9PROT|nr:hypothetical protein [Azospirillum oryzae]SMF47401.1 hypothetical protein SAMN02982917_2316 [Azospirillum oryzae]